MSVDLAVDKEGGDLVAVDFVLGLVNSGVAEGAMFLVLGAVVAEGTFGLGVDSVESRSGVFFVVVAVDSNGDLE